MPFNIAMPDPKYYARYFSSLAFNLYSNCLNKVLLFYFFFIFIYFFIF